MSDFNPIDISDSANHAIKNLTDCPTKRIGQIISDAIYLKFGDISYKAKQRQVFEKYGLLELEKRLKSCIKQIPIEKLMVPDFQTIMLAIDNLAPCINSEDLRNLFANLLSRSCNIDYKDILHPSFSEILRQMSPFDAKILKFFVDTRPKEIITYTQFNDRTDYNVYIPYTFAEYPEPELFNYISISISSLLRLGILAFEDDAIVHEISDFSFTRSSFYQKCEQERIAQGKYKSSRVEGQLCKLTPFGVAFVNVCFA